MNFEVRRAIGTDHPSLPGHFPDMPIVPGVVILDEILAALTKWRKNSRVTAIHTVKFLTPLKPDQPFTICFSEDRNADNEVDFCCRTEDRIIAEGRFRVCYGTN